MNDQDKEQHWVAGCVILLACILAIGIAVAAAIYHLRTPAADVVTAPAVPAAQRAFSAGTLDIDFVDGVLTLSGQVPDEDTKRRILASAQAAFGTDEVKDGLQVVAGSQNVWWKKRPLDIFARLRQLPEFWLGLHGEQVAFKANIANEETRLSILEWLRAAFADDIALDESGITVDAGQVAIALDSDVLLNEHIEFPSGSAQIPDEVTARLQLIARVLKDDDRVVRIVGHTDNTGDADGNMRLSLQRAQAVVDHLIKEGVPADYLRAEGMGQEKPIADNATDEGRQKNRRIEFVSA
ncbi:MAG: OmpA family protein [Rhodocyclaceae bacterium]